MGEIQTDRLSISEARVDMLRPQQRGQSDTSLVQQRLNEINHQGNQIKWGHNATSTGPGADVGRRNATVLRRPDVYPTQSRRGGVVRE